MWRIIGMPILDVFGGCILFYIENKVEKLSYVKLLAVKAANVEDVKAL